MYTKIFTDRLAFANFLCQLYSAVSPVLYPVVAVIICVREAIPHFYLRSQQYSCHIVTSTRRHQSSQPSPASTRAAN